MAERNLQAEIIKDMSTLVAYMPSPDEISEREGKGLHVYDEMFVDGRVSSLFYQRRNATLNLPVYLKDSVSTDINKFAHEQITEKVLRKWAWKLLSGAIRYGFRPAEIVWKRKGGYFVVDYLRGHNIDQYSFDASGRLYYTDINGQHLLNHPYKWIVHRHEGDSHDNPAGVSVLKPAYWPYKFKQLGLQFWVTATEKFSVPSIIALFEKAGNQEDTEQIAETLSTMIEEIQSGSGGALGNVRDLKELNMSGKVSDFKELITACDVQIAYALTGQSLATNNPDSGSRALGSVHADTMAGLVRNDARGLAYTLQEIIDMTIQLNFGEDAPSPSVEIDTGNYAPWDVISDAIEKNIPISKRALYSRYQIPEPEGRDDELLQPAETGDGKPIETKGSDEGTGEEKEEKEEGASVDKAGAGVQLNGAQVQAAAGIVKAVEAGELPRDSGLAQLKILFNLSEEQAEKMMGSAGTSASEEPKGKDFADTDTGKKKAPRPMTIL